MSRRFSVAAVGTVAALAAGWLSLMLLVWAYGESPSAIAAQMATGTWGMAYGVGQVLYKATPLLLTGAAVDLALRAGLFNIGAEGQLAIAGLAMASIGATLPPRMPMGIALPLVLAVAPVAGAAWAFVPAVLRARFGANEVISTIMTNRIADAVVGLSLAHGFGLPGTVRTPDIIAAARLKSLDALGFVSLHGSAVSLALPIAVVATWAASFWLARSRVGREIILVGMAPGPCAAERIPVARRLGTSLVLSGALAGMAAYAPVLGYKGYYESGLAGGAGFGGIAVALLGRGSPARLCLAALLFGTLEQGGLSINARVPMDGIMVLETVVIVAFALADVRVRSALVERSP